MPYAPRALVERDQVVPLTTGRIAIHDNVKHAGLWYYWLEAGQAFDLARRQVVGRPERVPRAICS